MKNEEYAFYDVCEANTIKELILTNEDEFAEDIAIKYINRRKIIDISYSQLKKDIDCLGTYFYMKGIKNKKVAILGSNSYEWALGFLTLTCSNNVAVPIDKSLKSTEILGILKKTDCSAIFYDSTYIDVIKEIQNKLKDLKIYIKFNEFNKCIEEGKIILKSGRRHFVFERIRNEETTAIFYTCTISSKMRGIELSHENIMSAALSNSQLVFLGDMTIAVIPFHYVFSIISELISPLIQKSTVIYPME